MLFGCYCYLQNGISWLKVNEYDQKRDKNKRKHHKQESQEVSSFPAGDHKAAMIRHDIMTDTKHR